MAGFKGNGHLIRMINRILLILLFFPWCVNSVEYEPWIGSYFEFEWRTVLRFQKFDHLACPNSLCKYRSNDLFLSTSLSVAVKPQFSLELEAVAASTRRQSGGIDHIRINGRYVWLDDIAGDPLTLTFGGGFIQGFNRSFKDKSSFHHGHSEVELFLSAGKECTKGMRWISRGWGMLGIGCAEKGSPWIRFNASLANQIKKNQEIEVFARTLWGLGHKDLDPSSFNGYGSIQHQSVDIGITYRYWIEFFGSISLEYAKRVHVRNFPAEAHQLRLTLLYTFGL
ncbi:MAG: hypothetical protein H0V82_01165 [Candidatus Protochlamydia sp.]|nr:hypothetical protein [Candidatus Protochlamydia sp.]